MGSRCPRTNLCCTVLSTGATTQWESSTHLILVKRRFTIDAGGRSAPSSEDRPHDATINTEEAALHCAWHMRPLLNATIDLPTSRTSTIPPTDRLTTDRHRPTPTVQPVQAVVGLPRLFNQFRQSWGCPDCSASSASRGVAPTVQPVQSVVGLPRLFSQFHFFFRFRQSWGCPDWSTSSASRGVAPTGQPVPFF